MISGINAVKLTGRKNRVMTEFWTEVCLSMLALQALTDGYFVCIVEDASSGTSLIAHGVAFRRIEQADGVPVAALQVLFEFQRDWARNEYHDVVVVRTLNARSSVFEPAAEAPAAPLAKPLPGSEALPRSR
jgi:hypothetical protein